MRSARSKMRAWRVRLVGRRAKFVNTVSSA